MEVRKMKEQDQGSSRREFLKKTIKATGYAIPAVMVFKMGSRNSWAQKYETRSSQNIGESQGVEQGLNSSDPCNGVFEKIFKTRCW